MITFGGHFGDFLVTFFGYRSLIDYGMHCGRLLAPFWLPFGSLWLPLAPFWLPFGSLWLPLASFGHPLCSLGGPFAPVCYLLVYLGLRFLTFYATELHFYVSPYKFLAHGARPVVAPAT